MLKHTYRPGDIVIANLNESNDGVLITKERPAIIVSNIDATRVSPILQIVPISSIIKKTRQPTHIQLYIKGKPNIALCEQIQTIEIDKLKPTDKWITLGTLNKIKQGLKVTLDIK